MEKPLMIVIRNTYRLWGGYMKGVAAQVGVPDSYRMALAFLLRNPGASQKELAAHCGITTPSASQTVKEMALTGYLRKEPDPEDQRYLRLYLTPKGEECARKIRARLRRADEEITRRLTPEKEAALTALLEELAEILEKEMPPC